MDSKKFEDPTQDEVKDLKIEFAPGCFDNFDGTQEELDALIADIKNMIVRGEFDEKSRQLTEEDFDELPEDVQEKLANFFEDTPKRKLQ